MDTKFFSKTKAAPKFSNRVRFNWGFHDATNAVEQVWATAENNFGFAKGGFGGVAFTSPADVLHNHPDERICITDDCELAHCKACDCHTVGNDLIGGECGDCFQAREDEERRVWEASLRSAQREAVSS